MNIDKQELRKVLTAWYNNNGIHGFIDYFFYPHQRSAFYATKEEMLKAFVDNGQSLTGDDNEWSEDYYVNEWWSVWKTADIVKVYFRSDGSFLDWLINLIEGEEE
tara:strand:+ start:422 stop:736 length:315 start_codon:yes stop_codon:yes gene_type:complete